MSPLFLFLNFELFTLLVEFQLSIQLLICHVDGEMMGLKVASIGLLGKLLGVNDINDDNYCDVPRGVMTSFQNGCLLKRCPSRLTALRV